MVVADETALGDGQIGQVARAGGPVAGLGVQIGEDEASVAIAAQAERNVGRVGIDETACRYDEEEERIGS